MQEYKLKVHSLESFGSVDGPGVRFVVFLQGCRMRCRYCHNPETWSMDKGEEYSVDKLCERVLKYRTYWGKDSSKGGVTVSGGEPLLQIKPLIEFMKILKQKGVHTAVDTSGQPFCKDEEFMKDFSELTKYVDLFILDIKQYDSKGHKSLTGFGNQNILEMAQYLSDNGNKMWIRHVLVPGLTDDEEDMNNIADFISGLKTVERVEVLPYHSLGMFKWEKLGISYTLKSARSPDREEMDKAEKIFNIKM